MEWGGGGDIWTKAMVYNSVNTEIGRIHLGHCNQSPRNSYFLWSQFEDLWLETTIPENKPLAEVKR